MKTELSNNILCGDCGEILRELPSNSIDLLVMCQRKRRACMSAKRAQWLSKVSVILYTMFFSKTSVF
ncbi:MAG: hypothetical protein LBJ67_14730, partial [Planctomycetaceae bacterium]|nr:hypothetical protein [Planctomycetaceae bacterium]